MRARRAHADLPPPRCLALGILPSAGKIIVNLRDRVAEARASGDPSAQLRNARGLSWVHEP